MFSDQTVSPAVLGTSQRLWRTVRHFWCRHPHTTTTPKTDTMPAHIVCDACGWREPVLATPPRATRTWDSTRDEARYERDKRRRLALEQQRQTVHAQSTTPISRDSRPRRVRNGNVYDLKRTAAR